MVNGGEAEINQIGVEQFPNLISITFSNSLRCGTVIGGVNEKLFWWDYLIRWDVVTQVKEKGGVRVSISEKEQNFAWKVAAEISYCMKKAGIPRLRLET